MSSQAFSSSVRVFFSVDLVGSTRLKNVLNHQELLEKYRIQKRTLDALKKRGIDPSDAIANTAILESLSVSDEDFDWASVVAFFFESFHSQFLEKLNYCSKRHQLDVANCRPWKAIGDELIYQFPVHSRRQLHWLTIAFLSALRSMDSKISRRTTAQGLRLKSSAWTAGFPVRNREIKIGTLDTIDFLGPDIDAGFRLGKCTREGMLVVSVELAKLLAECPSDVNPLLAEIVGWEELKGVWNNRTYPVIWIDFPEGFDSDREMPKAFDFDAWQIQGCPYCNRWQGNPRSRRGIRDLNTELEDLINRLPKNLGIVMPYILSDPDIIDTIPEHHTKIINLIEMVRRHQYESSKQDSEEMLVARTMSDTDTDALIKTLLDFQSVNLPAARPRNSEQPSAFRKKTAPKKKSKKSTQKATRGRR